MEFAFQLQLQLRKLDFLLMEVLVNRFVLKNIASRYTPDID